MARQDDSDSDEYEVMVPPGLNPASEAELTVIEAKTASEILQLSKSLTAPQSEREKVQSKVSKDCSYNHR